MNTFLTLLATMYVCDAMLADGPLVRSEHLRCATAFETLKIAFLTDEERKALREIGILRGDQTRQAFLRFRNWELDNSDIVARFRAEAEIAVMSFK